MSGKHVCVACQIELRVKENGVLLVSYNSRNEPTEAYEADLWHCPNCKTEIVAGVAGSPCDAMYNATVDSATSAVEQFKERLLVESRERKIVPVWLNHREKEQAAAC